jgi:isopentenyldiphosphate isomerase
MTMHKEPWQNYYINGQPVDKIQIEGESVPSGQQIGAANVWIWRDNGEGKCQILLQTRNEDKRLWPGYLDVSVAGHIDFGEQPIVTALRETHEELGLEFTPDNLVFIGTLPLINTWPDPPEPELHFIYSYQAKGDLQLNFSDKEVTAADWYDIDDIEQAVRDGHLKLAKADSPLFDFVLPAIKKL